MDARIYCENSTEQFWGTLTSILHTLPAVVADCETDTASYYFEILWGGCCLGYAKDPKKEEVKHKVQPPSLPHLFSDSPLWRDQDAHDKEKGGN